MQLGYASYPRVLSFFRLTSYVYFAAWYHLFGLSPEPYYWAGIALHTVHQFQHDGNERGRNNRRHRHSKSNRHRIDFLAGNLSGILKRKVLDRTGLAGRYDADLKWTPDSSTTGFKQNPEPPSDDGPSTSRPSKNNWA
jgi:hypothetical protein